MILDTSHKCLRCIGVLRVASNMPWDGVDSRLLELNTADSAGWHILDMAEPAHS